MSGFSRESIYCEIVVVLHFSRISISLARSLIIEVLNISKLPTYHLHIFTSSHLLIFTTGHVIFTSLYIFSSSLHICTSSHLHICTSHLYICPSSPSSHLPIFTSHLLTFISFNHCIILSPFSRLLLSISSHLLFLLASLSPSLKSPHT